MRKGGWKKAKKGTKSEREVADGKKGEKRNERSEEVMEGGKRKQRKAGR